MFIKAIRNDPRYRDAQIVGMIEAAGDNLSPQYYHKWWTRFQPYLSATHPERPEGLPGVPTGDKEKDLYDEQLNFRLRRGKIAFEEKFITGMSMTDRAAAHEVHVLATLASQMRKYSIICKQSEKNGIPILHKERSGKFGGGQDDAVMAVQILNTHSKRVQTDDQRLRKASEIYPFLWRVDEKLDEMRMARHEDRTIPDSIYMQGIVPIEEDPSKARPKKRAKHAHAEPMEPVDAPAPSIAAAAAPTAPPVPSAPAAAAPSPPGGLAFGIVHRRLPIEIPMDENE